MASTAVKMLTVLRPKGSYLSTILGTSPIALWPLSEAAGATSVTDSVAGFAGTPSNVTFGATTFPDGTPAPSFNGTTSVIDIYSAGLNTVFNAPLGSAFIWARVAAAAWTDGVAQFHFAVGADGNNSVQLSNTTTNNQLRANYYANSVYKAATTSSSATIWQYIGLTWDKANDRMRLYLNGAQQGADVTALGVWAGALGAIRCVIGASTNVAASPFLGNLKYFTLWNRELTPAEVAILYVSSFAV